MSQHILEGAIDRLLAGEASHDESATIRAHLASCAQCRAQWAGTLNAHEALAAHVDELRPGIAESAARLALTTPRRSMLKSWALKAAVLIAAVALGAFLGQEWKAREIASPDLPRYLFVFSGSRSQAMPIEEIAAIGRDFRTWTDSLVVSGRVVAHGQLRRGTLGLVAAAEPALDSATVRALGSMEGMLLVHAPDDTLAVALARTSPFLRYGGTIVVRRMSSASGASRTAMSATFVVHR